MWDTYTTNFTYNLEYHLQHEKLDKKTYDTKVLVTNRTFREDFVKYEKINTP